MNKTSIPDGKQRERIAEEIDCSFFVEAGAGSGKTKSLVDRMASLIRRGTASIDQIAAVTFTRKAAAELRERFQIKLESLLKEKNLQENEKKNIMAALSTFEQAQISTIHSFCARILRERPVEAGIDPAFTEIEDAENMLYAEEVWAQFVEQQGLENSGVLNWMSENDMDVNSLKDTYVKMVEFPDVEAAMEDIPKPDFTELKKQVREKVYSVRGKMPKVEPEDGWDELQSIIVRALKLMRMGYLDEDRLFVRLLNVLDGTFKITQKRWEVGKESKSILEDMQKFQESVINPALVSWQAYLHKPLINFALEGAKYYENWRKERSLLNFQDLLMRTAALLRKDPEIRAYFKKEIKYLLVDEFQDTDPIQAEIILLLTGEDDKESDWRKVKPKKGSLFLVGDPKQSIFRFRRADIDIYNQVKEIFRDGAGEVLELTSNFRSLDCIRDIVDAVFVEIFVGKDDRYQARFVPLNTVRDKSDKTTGGVFENRIDKIPYHRSAVIAQKDAETIAAWIKNSINGGLMLERTDDEIRSGKKENAEPGDFMIITRNKDRLSFYAEALEVLGIPYEISGGKNFIDSEELKEICKVLKAVADPGNPVAVVAALRGPFFGLSDTDLYNFAKEGRRFNYFTKLEKAPQSIIVAFNRLKEYNEIVMSHTPMAAIEKIIENLAAIPVAVSRDIGSTKAGNIFKAIDLLAEFKTDTTGSFAEIVDYLQDLLDSSETEEMSLFPTTTKAVRLMNLHKAKGLEAPVIILADPDPSGLKEHEPLFHINRIGEKAKGFFTVFEKKEERSSKTIAVPVDWEKHAEEEKKYEEAEKRRLDYVAVTRAKNILVISTYREGEREKNWELFYGYLGKMQPLSAIGGGKKYPVQERSKFEIDRQKWEKEKGKILNDIVKAEAESYYIRTVTGEIKEPAVFSKVYGAGIRLGSVVHKALEAIGRGKRENLEILVGNWLVEEGLPPENLKLVISKVDGTLKSDIWGRMLKATEKYFEVPFSASEENDVFSGIIDLVFKEDDEWVIVDYKTDDFEKDPARKAVYEKQVAKYAELWEKITGGKVKEKLIKKV